MKKIFNIALVLVVLISVSIIGLSKVEAKEINIPEATGYVVDTINLLNNSIKQEIETICKNLDSSAQMAVLIIDTSQPYSIEQYSIAVAEKWKVGYKGKDNGVILIVAKSDRKVRIEVGRGLEDRLNDATAGKIINNVIIPSFKAGDFNAGILNGVKAIQKEILK